MSHTDRCKCYFGDGLVRYCPLHAAAPELLEAVQWMLPWLGKLIADEGHLKSVRPQAATEALKLAEEAKAQAEGRNA